MSAELDFSARYRVAGYPGVAFYLRGFVVEDREVEIHDEETGLYFYEIEPTENPALVRAVMVGDDREHLVDVDDLMVLADDAYCAVCGQIGCGHDGR